MRIEAGKYYRTRDGKKVGPMVEENPRWSGWPFDVRNEDSRSKISVCLWKDDGTCDEGSQYDLVAEWTDTPKPWRDMTAEEKGALLLASYEGRVIQHATTIAATGRVVWNNCQRNWIPTPDLAYRVKPTVKEVILHGAGYEWGQSDIACDGDTHRITFNLIDGKPDCASIKMEEL